MKGKKSISWADANAPHNTLNNAPDLDTDKPESFASFTFTILQHLGYFSFYRRRGLEGEAW
jgi:hypothetical protein